MGGIIEERWRKGPWTAEEDRALIHHVELHGEGKWNSVASLSGLKRNGKSCRLRWVNYLRPDLKRGRITPHEETIILDLHARWGNRWSTIAKSLPGRTDNEIKNYWRTRFRKKTYDESAKLKTRLLKRQKFKQEQIQQQLHQLQMQQYEVDVKNIMTLLIEERENKHRYMPPTMLGRQQENGFEEQQNLIYPMIVLNGCHYGSSYVPDTSMSQDVGMWDSLWNLDDVHGSNYFGAAIAN